MYFKEKEEEKVLISEYVKELEKVAEDDKHILQDEKDLRIGKYLVGLFEDQKLDKSLIKEFIKCYSRFGGRYLVLSDDETLIGLKKLHDKYDLTTKAIEDIGLYYIKDLFDTYSLDKVLQDFIDTYGRCDEAYEKYIEFVDKIGGIYQKEFDSDAKEVEYLEDEYGKGLVEYLQSQIKFHHYHKDDLLKYLPEVELIQKDEDQLLEFATRSRIHFGVCYPKSYTLITKMLKDETLSEEPEEFKYYSSFGREIPLTFTKKEFIESTKKKQKIK
jgi:hypothetical protein